MGGKNHWFFSNNGVEGNTCLPKHLEAYIKAFKLRKIKETKKEISNLQKKLEKLKIGIEREYY